MSKTFRALFSIACAVAIIPGLACGRSTASSALPSEYCDAVKKVFHYDTGLHGEGDESAVKTAYAGALEKLAPAFDTIESDGTDDTVRAVRGLRTAYTAARDKGADPFESEAPRLSTLVRASRAGCGWTKQQVDASDFAFALPSRVDAGTVALRLSNRSTANPHVLLVVKVKAGVDKPVGELLAQFAGPATEADADIAYVNGGAFAFPGQTSFGVVDLTPGRYLYLCPIPVDGATSDDDNHASRGMRGEFVVA